MIHFGKRTDKDALMIFVDACSGQIVWYKFVESEKLVDYEEGLSLLLEKGFVFTSITVDCRPGLKDLACRFTTLVQICQFHQIQIVLRYLTHNPKLVPAQQLKTLIESLPKTSYQVFKQRFDYWLEVNQDFLSEQTTNPETNRKHYTHKRLRSAVKSIQNNLPFLFTYQKNIINPEVFTRFNLKPPSNIPNTTNHLDGGVNPKIRELVRIHRGMKKERRNKLVSVLLKSLGGKKCN